MASFKDILEFVLYKTKAASGKVRLIQRSDDDSPFNFVQIGKFTSKNSSKLVVTLNIDEIRWLILHLPTLLDAAGKKEEETLGNETIYRKITLSTEKLGNSWLVGIMQEVESFGMRRRRNVSFSVATWNMIMESLPHFVTMLTERERQITAETDDLEDLSSTLSQLVLYYVTKKIPFPGELALHTKTKKEMEIPAFQNGLKEIRESPFDLLKKGKAVLSSFCVAEDFSKCFVEGFEDLMKTEIEVIKVHQQKESIDKTVRFLCGDRVSII